MAHAVSRPPKTVQDYLALPGEPRAELVRGEIYMTPSPTPRHQMAAYIICSRLFDHGSRTGTGRAFVAPLDVHLPSGEIVQPDVLFVRTGNPAIAKDAIRGVPDLLVEVVSPSRPEWDRFVKRTLYLENRVPEYWIVDPSEESVEILRCVGSEYVPSGWFVGRDTLTSPGFPGLSIPLAEVFSPLP